MRTLRSKHLRNALWLAADGKCQLCGRDLPEDWHADHIVPYSETERTNVHEMQALCPTCNLRKGANHDMLHYALEYYPGVRSGVLTGLLKYKEWLAESVERWKTGTLDRFYWSAIFPTRYGKSDFIRTAALIGIKEGLTAPCLVLTPAIVLARQLFNDERMVAWRRRWNVVCTRKHITLKDFCPRPYQNNEWIGAVHIQALVNEGKIVGDFAEHLVKTFGLPPVMFVDETHRYTLKNKWGDVPRAWVEAGGLCVPVTATGYRHDGDDLLGFHKEVSGREDEIRQYNKQHSDPKKYIRVTEVGEKVYYRLAADFEVSYKTAWAEKAIARSTVDWIDVEIKDLSSKEEIDREDQNLKLSEIARSKVSRYLGTVCRDPKVIRDFARRIVKHLRVFRGHESTADASFIVYGMNDESAEGNNTHLELIFSALRREDPSLKLAIATLKADKYAEREDEKAIKQIEKFTDTKLKTLDGLLLKQMGSEGLDSDRICVVGTLDNVRSAVAKIQQWNRGGNIWGNCRHFVIVTLKDRLNTEIYDTHIKSEGGEASAFDVITKEEETKDKSDEGPEPPLFSVIRTTQSGALDSDGLNCTPLGYSRACRLLEELPEQIHYRTIPQLAPIAERLGIDPLPDCDEPQAPANVADETSDIVARLNEATKSGARFLFRIANGRFPDASKKEERDECWGTFRARFIARVKEASGVSGTWDQANPNRIRCLDTLRTLLNVAEQLIARMAGEVS